MLTPRLSLYHASRILSGRSDLHRQGVVAFPVDRSGPEEPWHDCVVCLDIRRLADSVRRRVVVDLADRADEWSQVALESADVYFKRSYVTDVVEELPPLLQTKVRRFGLNFSCMAVLARWHHLHATFLLLTGTMFSHRKYPLRMEISRFVANLKLLGNQPVPAELIADEAGQRKPLVLFQTRIWPPEPSKDDLEQVNRDRCDLVRLLRRELGERFIGGIQADAFSRTAAPDVVVENNTHRLDYLRMIKGCTVGVYARGLHHSMAFKLPEYLAAGLCVVSEPLRHELPEPLLKGVHYLEYRSSEECLSHCRRLLDDAALAGRMSQANRQYYLDHVEPATHARSILDRAFEARP